MSSQPPLTSCGRSRMSSSVPCSLTAKSSSSARGGRTRLRVARAVAGRLSGSRHDHGHQKRGDALDSVAQARRQACRSDGCGLALASPVAHRRGADVTASDCHPLAQAFLLENLRLNDLAPLSYRCDQWDGSRDQSVAASPVGSSQRCGGAIGPDHRQRRPLRTPTPTLTSRSPSSSPDAEVWIKAALRRVFTRRRTQCSSAKKLTVTARRRHDDSCDCVENRPPCRIQPLTSPPDGGY